MFKRTKLFSLATALLLTVTQSLLADSAYSEFEKAKNSAGLDMTDTVRDFVLKMSGLNPGALSVLVEFANTSAEIDPDAMFPFNMLGFDSYGILNSKIWMLYKDVCKQDITCVHAVMRSLQLGIEKEEKVYHAIENRGEGLDTAALLVAVQGYLPKFGQQKATAAVVMDTVNEADEEKPEAPQTAAGDSSSSGAWVIPVTIGVIGAAYAWHVNGNQQFPIQNQ